MDAKKLRKTYIASSYGELRQFSETQWKKWLEAIANNNTVAACSVWSSGRYLGWLDAEVSDYTPDIARERLEMLNR